MANPPTKKELIDIFNSAVQELSVNKNYKSYRDLLHDDVVIFHIYTADAMYGKADVDANFGTRFGKITFTPGAKNSFDELSGIVEGEGATWIDTANNRRNTVDFRFIFTYVRGKFLITNLRAWPV
jgi:hypothetical protein